METAKEEFCGKPYLYIYTYWFGGTKCACASAFGKCVEMYFKIAAGPFR